MRSRGAQRWRCSDRAAGRLRLAAGKGLTIVVGVMILVAGLALAGCAREPAEEPATATVGAAAAPPEGCVYTAGFKPVYPDAPRCKAMGFNNRCCPITAADLSWAEPIDTCVFAFNGWHFQQPDLDHFSWLSFIALNWPADLAAGRGVADPSARPQAPTPGAGNGTTVWQTFKDVAEVFPSSGTPSKEWNAPPPPPPSICPELAGAPVLRMTSKSSAQVSRGGLLAIPGDTVSELGSLNQAFTGPLVDRNGALVLYDIKINRTEFEVITANGFNTGTPVPADFLFPTDTIGDDGLGPNGAVEVKAAWKQLTDAEWARGSFFQQEALFYYSGDPGTPAFCDKVKLGLVGFHIAHKIYNIEYIDQKTKQPAHQWVWSTFEHVDNVPAPGAGAGDTYSFYDPSCQPAVTAEECAALTDPPVSDEKVRCCQNLWRWKQVGNGGDPYSMPRTADQVTRIDPLAADSTCSEIYLGALAGTVWENYFLVGTQWIDIGADNPTIPPKVTPTYLRNTTLETYFAKWQDEGGGYRQVNVSSCDSCHSGGVDHSYIFLAGGVD